MLLDRFCEGGLLIVVSSHLQNADSVYNVHNKQCLQITEGVIFAPPPPHLVDSHDQAFFEPSVTAVSELAGAGTCVVATLHTNGVPNMDKLEFGLLWLDASEGSFPKVLFDSKHTHQTDPPLRPNSLTLQFKTTV